MFLKAPTPISSNKLELSNLAVDKFEHPLKAASPIVLTVLEISTFSKLVKEWKANSPTEVTPFSINTVSINSILAAIEKFLINSFHFHSLLS